MQKKSRLLLFLPVMLICIIVISITTGVTAFATTETDSNYSVVFPSEDTYVKLENPTSIGVTGNELVIYDNGKLFVKGRFMNPIQVADTNIRSLQISNDLICYIASDKVNIISRKNPTNNLQNDFETKLHKLGLENDSIFDIYLNNNILYFVLAGKKILYSITLDNGVFTEIVPEETEANLFLISNLVVNQNFIFYTKDNFLTSFDRQSKTTKQILKLTDKLLFNDNYIIEYNTSTVENNSKTYINIKDNKNQLLKSLSNSNLNIKKVDDVKIAGNSLFICDNGSKDIVEFDINDLITKNDNYPTQNVYGMTGDFKDKLNKPTSVKYNNNTYVLDLGNNKVKDITNINNILEYKLDSSESIIDFEINDNTIYYFTANKLHIYNINTMEDKPIDIANIRKISAYKDTILLQIDNTIQLLDKASNTTTTLLTTENIKDFALNKEGDFVYIYTAKNIDKYIFDNEKLVKISFNINLTSKGITSEIIDFEIDKNGNVYLLFENNIAYIKNSANEYKEATIIKLNNTFYNPNNLTDIAIVNNNLFVTDNGSNLLYKITDSNFTNIQTTISTEVVTLAKKPLEKEMSVKKTTADTIMYTYLDNLEIANIIPSGKIVWVFNEPTTIFTDKVMVLYDNKIGFIYSNTLNDVAKINNSFNGKAITNTTLYMYPSVCKDAKLLTIDITSDNTKMRVLSTTENFDKDYLWYEVEYEGKRYFAVQNDITKDDEKIQAISTMIVKSKKIGENVKMYQLADTNSDVITTIKDGETVEILSTNGDFYKVKYKDKIGFIHSDNLIKNGLTNNQIVAIVISCVTLVVALIIFVTTIIIRHSKNKIK